jgi:hypothetical protein
MRGISIAALVSGLLASVAAADDWSGVGLDGGWYRDRNDGTLSPISNLIGNEGVVVNCSSSTFVAAGEGAFDNCPASEGASLMWVPISAFARTSTVQALTGRVSAVESGLGAIGTLSAQLGALSTHLSALAAYVPAIQQQMEQTTWRGAAMAAALDSVGPAAGKRNRLGTNAATVNGETAVALNYVYAGDTMDVSAGVAYSEGEAISKVGVGISW